MRTNLYDRIDDESISRNQANATRIVVPTTTVPAVAIPAPMMVATPPATTIATPTTMENVYITPGAIPPVVHATTVPDVFAQTRVTFSPYTSYMVPPVSQIELLNRQSYTNIMNQPVNLTGYM